MAEAAKRTRRGWVSYQSVFWFRLLVLLVEILLRFWVRRFRAIGAENVPSGKGVFLIANHTSALDPFLLGYPVARRAPRGPAKEELFTHPVAGFLMRKIGMFPIRQDVADPRAVRAMVELYRGGCLVIVFPEGGRSDSGELQPFFPEFTRLLLKLRATVVPAGLAGAREALPIGRRIPHFNTSVAVVIGQPIDLSEYFGRELGPETISAATSLLEQKVAETVCLARAEGSSL